MAPAIFEVKTYTGCNLRYNHATTMHPTNRRAKDIKKEYVTKFWKLDTVFAVDVVGNVSGAIEGLFTRAQRCFHSKEITPPLRRLVW